MLRNSKKEFVYVLKVTARLREEENWRENHRKTLENHFKYLKNLLSEGKLIMAGDTSVTEKSNVELVIIKAYTEEEAKNLMNNDPGIKEGIMEGSIYNFKISLKS